MLEKVIRRVRLRSPNASLLLGQPNVVLAVHCGVLLPPCPALFAWEQPKGEMVDAAFSKLSDNRDMLSLKHQMEELGLQVTLLLRQFTRVRPWTAHQGIGTLCTCLSVTSLGQTGSIVHVVQ